MDHKVSKDMISSGMIPSGEKTQADLGRTQYGSAPSPNKLMDAYKSMYEKKEEVINEHHKKDADGNTIPHEGENVDEAIVTGSLLTGALLKKFLGSTALKLATKAGTMAGKFNTAGGFKGLAGKGLKSMAKNPLNTMVGASILKPGPKMPSAPVNAVQQTKLGRRTAGMYNDVDLFDIVKGQLLDEGLTEEECTDVMTTLTIDEINEGLVGNVARLTAAGTVAAMGADAIRKQMQNKEKMDKGGKFKKGGIMDTIQKKNQMMQGM